MALITMAVAAMARIECAPIDIGAVRAGVTAGALWRMFLGHFRLAGQQIGRMQHAFPHYDVLPTSAGLQIIDRTRSGREAAKARGVRFGRRPTLTPGQVEHARDLLSQGRTAAEAAELLGVHRATLYRALGGQETTQAEARRLGAFVEDALTEADALAAADQEGTKA